MTTESFLYLADIPTSMSSRWLKVRNIWNLLLRITALIGNVFEFLDGHAYVWDCLSSEQLWYTAGVTSQESSHLEATGIAWCSGDEEGELPLFVCGNKGGGLTIWEGRGSESNLNVPLQPISGASGLVPKRQNAMDVKGLFG